MSGTSSSDALRDLLDRESERFSALFPGLSARFAEVLGRRLSHLAGSHDSSAAGDLRLDLAAGLVAFVSGPWRGREDEVRSWSESVSMAVSGLPGTRPGGS